MLKNEENDGLLVNMAKGNKQSADWFSQLLNNLKENKIGKCRKGIATELKLIQNCYVPMQPTVSSQTHSYWIHT